MKRMNYEIAIDEICRKHEQRYERERYDELYFQMPFDKFEMIDDILQYDNRCSVSKLNKLSDKEIYLKWIKTTGTHIRLI